MYLTRGFANMNDGYLFSLTMLIYYGEINEKQISTGFLELSEFSA